MIALCCIAAGLVTWYPAIFTSYALFFSVQTISPGADALVVLSGGVDTRLPLAIKLYRDGYARQILLTETRLRNMRFAAVLCNQKDNARALLEFFKMERAPVQYVPSLKGGATSTFDEAYDLRRYSLNKGFKHLILVTDNYHTRRAQYAFEKIFRDTGIRIDVAGAPNDIFDETNWWRSDTGISTYIMAGIKYLVYRFNSRNAGFIKNY